MKPLDINPLKLRTPQLFFLPLLFFTSACVTQSPRPSLAARASTPKQHQASLLHSQSQDRLSQHWLSFSHEKEAELTRWRPRSVKIIFELQDKESAEIFYLISKKKVHGKNKGKKHKRWEFPGGRLDKSETVSQCLFRELKEEDSSGVLASIISDALNAGKRPLQFRNIVLSNGERHTLFRSSISSEEWKSLSVFWKDDNIVNPEVKGYKLLSAKHFENKSKQKWTPKSLKLLKAIRV